MGPSVRQRRFTAIKQADLSAISERDVYDIAAIFIRGHGARAARQVRPALSVPDGLSAVAMARWR